MSIGHVRPGKNDVVKRYLIECGEKGGTHETKKDDPEAIFWHKMLLFRLPRCTRFSL